MVAPTGQSLFRSRSPSPTEEERTAGEPDSMPRVNVGLLPAVSARGGTDQFQAFLRRMAEDARPVLEDATGAPWAFQIGQPAQLENDEARRPSDFLPQATLRLAEGSFDLVVVVTDVPLVSATERLVAGLASPITRTCVLSARKLRAPSRKERCPLDEESVRWNAAALLLHLIGHSLGLKHDRGAQDVMAPFAIEEGRRSLPGFARPEELRRLVARFPEPEFRTEHWARDLQLHLSFALRHPGTVLTALWRNRAPLLPLRMPGLATAAVAPTFLLVFTAEFWDAGLGMSNLTAWTFALVSILAATFYLSFVQNLFLPRKERHIVTEHLAVANVVIFLTMLLAVIGLFLMIALLMLAIEVWVFPAGLIATWPTLQDPEVTLGDKFRLAAFISTIGVITGSLAGGLERRNVMRSLALFQTEV